MKILYEKAFKDACKKLKIAETPDHEQLFLFGVSCGIQVSKEVLMDNGVKK